MITNLRIVIAGGSGFLGTALARRWGATNSVTVLSRQQASGDKPGPAVLAEAGIHPLHWDGKTQSGWAEALEGCDLLVNLAGKSVNCRYTAENKAAILSSRLDSTRALAMAVRTAARPPALWVNASSATIYPNATDHPYDEWSTEREGDFSVRVVQAWEAAFGDGDLPCTRRAALRTSIVLGEDGALKPYARLARWGLGGKQGSGRQQFSWIHVEDFARIIEWLWDHPEQDGVFNAAAPRPVRNVEFMGLLRRFYGVPFGLPAPAPLLKIAAAVLGTETELLLKSRWVLPTRLLRAGFVFSQPDLPAALADLLRPKRRARAVRPGLVKFKRADVWIQTVLWMLGILTLPLLGPAVILYGLGAWQLVSALVHFSRRREYPPSRSRRRYNRTVVALLIGVPILSGLLLLLETEAGFSVFVCLLAGLLLAGLALAIAYYFLCRAELRGVSVEPSDPAAAGLN